MTPERWLRVGELFHQALDAPTQQRTRWLHSQCTDDPELLGEIRSLLGSDRSAGVGFVEAQLKPAIVAIGKETAISDPVHVGPYRLIRELGRGGMGTVYLAERDDEEYQTQVAIKVVRRGMDTDLILHRFRRERQTLARLQHPNIARLLDGNTTDEGSPYIVMEFVDGTKITEYANNHALTLTQRLSLFFDVSAAVAYAHRNFVVHRDLKPGNILVDESGTVKLLDFGICKLLQSEPQVGDETMDVGPAALTPDYASPEQVLGNAVTVTSDVYSLAAVLYELLTGVRPHKIEEYTLRGIERGVCDSEPLLPSQAAPGPLASRLEGDLDNILMCALHKEPLRRYPSVEQFSEDVRRHLAHEPVKARPDTVAYRVHKFILRRRGLVAAAAIVLLSLSAALIVSVRSARTANENVRMVRSLSNTFVFDVHDAIRDLPGSTRARQMIVQTGLRYLDTLSRNASGDAELQGELAAAYHRIGDVQGNVMAANLGNTTGALASYRKALALVHPVIQEGSADRKTLAEEVTLYHRIADIYAYTKDFKQASKSYDEAEMLAIALTTRYPKDEQTGRELASIYVDSADVLRMGGDYQTPLAKNQKALAILNLQVAQHPGDPSLLSALATAYSAIGMCDVRLGRLKEGLEGYRQAALRMDLVVKMDPANVSHQRGLMFAYGHIGDVLGSPNLNNLGDTAGAIDAYRQMLATARHVHLSDPADQRASGDYGIALSRLAAVLPAEQAAERLTLLRQALTLHRQVAQINPTNRTNQADMGFAYNLLGDTLLQAGDRAAAVRAYTDGLQLFEPMVDSGPASNALASVLLCRKLGEIAATKGQRDVGLTYARRALQLTDPSTEIAKRRPPESQRFLTPRGLSVMGFVYAGLAKGSSPRADDKDQAQSWLSQGRAAWMALQNHPAFASPHKRELRMVEETLKNLQ
ncbi:MAG: protein kinase [Bryobacteraceae bacterium]|nr:protein kinase [Bryobacteraceae bacterium]